MSELARTKPKLIVAAAVVVGVVALVATQANGESGPSLRTAIATNRSVSKTIDEVGTIEPVSAASVGFPVAGTVASVSVAKGATVTRGQALATLDTADLERAINTAKATLAQAKLKLADAIAGNATASESNSRVQAQANDELAAAQQAVLQAQQEVDQRISAAQAAYESATSICEAVTADTVATCQGALTEVMNAQQATADAQRGLSDASNALEVLRGQSDNKSDAPQAQSTTASAADLAAMQKDIDAANAAIAVANQNLSAATIVSPMDGTIESVGMKRGDSVAAASSDAVIKVVGPNGFEVTTIVAVEKLANIKLGQQATVRPDGSNETRQGEVVAIGAPRTSNGATSYPVSIGLDDDDSLRNGSVASVSITTGSAASGIAVPTTAVHTESGRSTVTVVKGSKLEVVSVTVGVVGKVWTQIKSGLDEGQRVVIADLDEPLPDSATSSSNNNGDGQIKGVEIPRGAVTGPIILGPPPSG